MASKIEKINFKDKKTRFKRPNNQEEYLFTAENVNEIKNKLNGMIDGYNTEIVEFPTSDVENKIKKVVDGYAPSIPGNQYNELNKRILNLEKDGFVFIDAKKNIPNFNAITFKTILLTHPKEVMINFESDNGYYSVINIVGNLNKINITTIKDSSIRIYNADTLVSGKNINILIRKNIVDLLK